MRNCNCNYCKVERYRDEARKTNSRLVTLRNKELGGTDLYLLPEGEGIPKAKDIKLIKKYLKEWFKDIPYKCEAEK